MSATSDQNLEGTKALTVPDPLVSIVTVTIGRPSLEHCCASVEAQTFRAWHHYVLGDGVRPVDFVHPQRSTLGFTEVLGATEPALNMPDGTPNPLLRWAIRHLDLAPFVCFLDDDNVYQPEFLARMVASLEANPDVGLALCAVENRRAKWRDIDGFPEYRRCDNSAFLARSACAKAVGFPKGGPDRECVQDYEFIRDLAQRFGWTRVGERLTIFGAADNTPPNRGGIRVVYSWALPVRGLESIRAGHLSEGLDALEEAVERDPQDAWAWWHLGEGRLVNGDAAGTRAAWRRFTDLLDRLTTFPDDWSEYCYALSIILSSGIQAAIPRLQSSGEAARRNHFEEPLLQAENELNLALYAVVLGSPSMVKQHLSNAEIIGLDAITIYNARWKADILERTLRLVDTNDRHQRAFAAFRSRAGQPA